MKWLDVRNVISEAIVQKHLIKSVYCNSQALKRKAGIFSREATQPTSKLSQELQRWRAEGTQILHSDGRKYVVWLQIVILLSLSLCCHFRYPPHANCCLFTWNWASVLTPVTSQTNGLPPCHGIRVVGRRACSNLNVF